MEVTRTFDLLDRYKQLFHKETALAVKSSGTWKTWSTDAYIEACYDVAYGLLELGFSKGDKMTNEVFDAEGWFHTGDMGHLEDGKFLVVTDRKKEIFKLSNGKFVAPQVIEGIFKQSPMIDNIMVIGEHQKFASALIIPAFDQLSAWADENNVLFSSKEELICMPEVQRHFQKEINGINKTVSDHERLLRFRLIIENWSPESGELSPTLKLKRRVVSENYNQLIESIYA